MKNFFQVEKFALFDDRLKQLKRKKDNYSEIVIFKIQKNLANKMNEEAKETKTNILSLFLDSFVAVNNPKC